MAMEKSRIRMLTSGSLCLFLFCFIFGDAHLMQDPQDKEWKCIHGNLKQPKIMFAVNTVVPHDSRTGRSVEDDYQPIRIHVEYDRSVTLNKDYGSRLQNKIIPETVKFFEQTLAVKRSKAPIVLSRPCDDSVDDDLPIQVDPYPMCRFRCEADVKCGEFTIPDNHLAECQCSSSICLNKGSNGTGVSNADFVLYVTAVNSDNCAETTLAYASYCGLERSLDRPVAGYMNFCPLSLQKDSDDERIIFIAKHELTHALAFSLVLYPFWRDSAGNPRTPRGSNGLPSRDFTTKLFDISSNTVDRDVKFWNTFTGRERRATNTFSLVTSAIVNETRSHFGCPTASGLELNFLEELQHGRPGSHWDKKLVENELMSPIITKNGVISSLTLALFEDSGWYKVNYSAAEPFYYGKNLGCDFMEESCYTWMLERSRKGQSIQPYCNVSVSDVEKSRDCTYDRQSVARCGIFRHDFTLADRYRYFSDSSVGGTAGLALCPIPLDRGTVEGFNRDISSTSYNDGRCRIPENQPDSRDNEFAESYGIGSRCVNHGKSRKWHVNRRTVSDSGAGCYQYHCTKQGVVISVLGVNFLCPCEGKEIAFDMNFPKLRHRIQGSFVCPSCQDMCWDEPEKCPTNSERNACSNSVFSYSVDCSSSFVTSCFEEKGINETKLVCSPTCLNGLCVDGVCHCEENYFGSACENFDDPNECDPPCQNGGSCVNKVCQCRHNYFGSVCENFDDPNVCDPPCQNGGSCINNVCQCRRNYFGSACENFDGPNVCDPPCQNGGSCVNNVCQCSWNYTGRLCETFVDPTICNPACQNGGTCFERKCLCVEGYFGVQCQNDHKQPPIEEHSAVPVNLIAGVSVAGGLVLLSIILVLSVVGYTCFRKYKSAHNVHYRSIINSTVL